MKSLEERIADREARKAKAQAEAKKNGTAAPSDDDGNGEDTYESKTVAQLKEDLDGREIAYPANAKKADLIKLLQDNDGE